MKKIASRQIISTGIVLLFFNIIVPAQNVSPVIFPQPQRVELTKERFKIKTSCRFTGELKPEESSVDLLNKAFHIGTTGDALPIEIKNIENSTFAWQRSGAYRLILSAEKITIEAFDQRSVFYAVQTILQLIHQAKKDKYLPVGTIIDYPDVAYRGTVEGFYGEPWTHEDRLSQFHFYGKMKLNTYIYGPKDDPYHSSPNWRKAYPPAEAGKIKELVREAANNQVDFVWAIHPGKDIQWNQKDSMAVLQKFEWMYELGVRRFAVFFDDISGVGTDAVKQAGLLNYIQHNFIRTKKDAGALIMCPTEYNKSWSNQKPGTYLDILGEQLDPAIHIMWTGNSVVDDITKEGLEWVNKRIRRPAFVWWNFPVSDYVRDHLLMGPAYGLETNAATDMSGFVSNPMDKAEASKVAIFGVALYSWNMKSYQPKQAWNAANKMIMPEASAAFQLFTTHNIDPGFNYHRYRREESADIKPTIDSFLNAYKRGNYIASLATVIKKEFQQISRTPAIIQTRSTNQRLVQQLSPWLIQFEWLGKAGVRALEMCEALQKANHTKAWDHYLSLEEVLDSMRAVDKQWNQNPYQPGVKTGSLVLTPFVKSLFWLAKGSLSNPGLPDTNAIVAMPVTAGSSMYTNSEKLNGQPLQITNESIGYSPALEVLTLNSGEYFGIKLSEDLKSKELKFYLESGSLMKWGAFEWSADAANWQLLQVVEKKGKGTVLLQKDSLKYIRFRNTSATKQTIYLKEFRLMVSPVEQAGQALYAMDGSVDTYQTVSDGETLAVKLPAGFPGSQLRVLISKESKVSFAIVGLKEDGRQKKLYVGKNHFLCLKKKEMKGIGQLFFSVKDNGAMNIHEIIATKR